MSSVSSFLVVFCSGRGGLSSLVQGRTGLQNLNFFFKTAGIKTLPYVTIPASLEARMFGGSGRWWYAAAAAAAAAAENVESGL